MLAINGSNVGEHVWVEQSGVFGDQVCPGGTINELPDEVLLEIFELYVGHDVACPLSPQPHKVDSDAWHTLVHVCRRWRHVVFGSPCRLDLRLLCGNTRLTKPVDIWPELPIFLRVKFFKTYQWPSVIDVISMLKNCHDRVCKISINNVPNSFLEEVVEITEPFPALIELKLASPEDSEDVPDLPDSFLDGCVPCLRSLDLWGIPFPGIGKFLLSTRDLVTLSLNFVPPSGFISPEEMVAILYTLTRLKSLHLSIQIPEFWTHGASQPPSGSTRVVLPALTNFDYYGNSDYLEGIVSRIDAPLTCIVVIFSDELVVSDIPSFRDFIRLTKIPDLPYRVDTSLSKTNARIKLFQQHGDIDFKVLDLNILFSSNTLARLSSIAQACSTFFPPLPNLEHLAIYTSDFFPLRGQDEVDNTRWMELFRPFTTVKDLILDELVVLSVASALQELVGERVTENLPVLQNIFLEGSPPSGLVPEGIAMFVTAREASGHPVIVHHRERKQ